MIGLKPCIFRFSDIEVREAERLVTRAAKPLSLEPKIFQILVYLLHNPGHLVSKDELVRAVWSNTAVTDSSLTRAMTFLRRALGDDPRDPRFIETISTVGYRFICPVALIEEPSGQGSSEIPQRSVSNFRGGRVSSARRGWVVIAVAVALIGAATVLILVNVPNLRHRLAAALGTSRDAARSNIGSIAVLPFENLSGDPSQDYFADGMTDELITELGSFGSVRVISRTSVMRFKGSRKPLQEIARELGVDGIVEGTVAHSGNHVRITANFIDAISDRHLWAKSYEGEMEDILIVQNRVAQSVADSIGAELTRQQRQVPAAPRRVNPEAFRAYLEGRYQANKLSWDGFAKAESRFQRSIELDPAFAPAYSAIANLNNFLAVNGIHPAATLSPLAKAAASKAVELDPRLAEAHSALGMTMLLYDWNWKGAELEHKLAIRLNPNSAEAHQYYGIFLTAMGRWNEAIREGNETARLDPASPYSNLLLAWILYWARRHDEAISQLNNVLELDTQFVWAYMELGWNYAEKRMYPEAIRNCRRALDMVPDSQVILATCGHAYGAAGRRREALALLARLQKTAEKAYVDPWYLSGPYDGVGDIDHAIEYLQRAYNERSASLYMLKVVLFSDRLRSDPRFQTLLKQLNFPS